MADQFVAVPNSGAAKVDTSEITVGANTVERQRINLADPTTAAAIAAVENAAPALSDYGIVVRQIGQGQSTYHAVAAASNNAANIKSSAGMLYGYVIFNNAGYVVFVKLYDKASSPTVGSDTPLLTVGIQAGTRAEIHFGNGLALASGLGIGIVKGIADADNTAVAASDCVANIFYK